MTRKPTPTIAPTSDPSHPSADPEHSLELMFGPDLLHTIPISQIVPSRWQPRTAFDPEPLLELANDIDRHGILTPPILWRNEDNEYELIAGERRIRAATALNLAAGGYDLAKAIAAVAKDGFIPYRTRLSASAVVPVRLISGSPAKLHEIALVDNLLREDLNPIEEARALQDLIDEYHYTQRDLAARIGKSQTWIAHRLNLLHLEPKLAARLIAGDIDPSLARDLARIPPGAQAPALAAITTQGLKSKKASTYISKLLTLSDPDAWTAPDPGSRIIAHQLRQLTEAERVQRILKAETDITPDRPPERWQRDRITNALAAAATKFDQLWLQHAPAIDATCATCQYNPHRAAIAGLRTRAAPDASYLIAASDYPACDAAGAVNTCPAHLPLSAPTVAYLSGSLRTYINSHGPDYPTVHQSTTDRWADYVAGDIPEWLRLQNDYLATRVVERQQETVASTNIVAEAIKTYQARQTEIDPAHPLSQPCARCALARRDGVCSILDAPPTHETWRIERRHRILDAAGDHRIGRCEAYRLRSWSDLPPVPAQAALRLDDDLLIPLLRRLIDSAGQRTGPSWLNVARSGVYDPPAIDACIDHLARHLPDATPAQRLAILLLWRDPIVYGYTANLPENVIKLHNPYLGETIAYTIA